jgi:bifunctional DNA-binding transcriptional regulator/antitoxin component of YhaV-PrlF toxin-antitoxin module
MQITHDGQITIPQQMQQQLGLEPGAEVHLEIVGSTTLQLTKKISADDRQSGHHVAPLQSAFGFLPKRVDPQQFQAQMRQAQMRDEWQR